jgi:hypothetical protein
MNQLNNKAIIITIIISITAFLLSNCSEEKKPVKPTPEMDTTNTISMKADPVVSSFSDIRNKTLNTSPTELGISIADEKTKVYGAMMEVNIDGRVHSVYSFENGDAGLLIGTGETVLNTSKKPTITKSAKSFLLSAKNYLSKTKRAAKTPVPEKEIIKFYLITNKGTYVGTEVSVNIENNLSQWTTLYDRGSDLLVEFLKEKQSK